MGSKSYRAGGFGVASRALFYGVNTGPSSSIRGNNRVVFNVGGNKYRLVVEMQYRAGIV
jgi:hypothetical protein